MAKEGGSGTIDVLYSRQLWIGEEVKCAKRRRNVGEK